MKVLSPLVAVAVGSAIGTFIGQAAIIVFAVSITTFPGYRGVIIVSVLVAVAAVLTYIIVLTGRRRRAGRNRSRWIHVDFSDSERTRAREFSDPWGHQSLFDDAPRSSRGDRS